MTCNSIIFKGGYGEHGRSCFLLPYGENFVMVDCGIMDTDSNPYPEIEKEVLEKVTYIFITHCHKDHAFALPYFIENGFIGTVVATRATVDLGKITHEKVIMLDKANGCVDIDDGLQVEYGRSGHCPGSVWYHLNLDGFKYFFSGDYQEDTLAYQCDAYKGEADIAVIDCAHRDSDLTAAQRREEFLLGVKREIESGNKVILPVQKYGRGIEMYYQLLTQLKEYNIKCDMDFYEYTNRLYKYEDAFGKEQIELVKEKLKKHISEEKWDIYIMGDTHIEKDKNIIFLKNMDHPFTIVVTGRIKKGGTVAWYMKKGVVKKYTYSHHQSEKDMERVISHNKFKVIFPFHNNEKKVIFY